MSLDILLDLSMKLNHFEGGFATLLVSWCKHSRPLCWIGLDFAVGLRWRLAGSCVAVLGILECVADWVGRRVWG
jgi:hypothetical protein